MMNQNDNEQATTEAATVKELRDLIIEICGNPEEIIIPHNIKPCEHHYYSPAHGITYKSLIQVKELLSR